MEVHHAHRTRAGTQEHVCTEQSSNAEDTGGKNKTGLQTQHSHKYSLRDNAGQETVPQGVQRLRPQEKNVNRR